jgi:hypothetical protein
MICYGVADALGSYGFGFIIKYVGRIPCFLLAAIMNYGMICLMIFWNPEPGSIVPYLIAVFWGKCITKLILILFLFIFKTFLFTKK